MKKMILLLVFAIVVAGGIFAQATHDGSFKNTIFFAPVMAGYERSIFPMLLVGAEVGIDLFGLSTGDSDYSDFQGIRLTGKYIVQVDREAFKDRRGEGRSGIVDRSPVGAVFQHKSLDGF